MSHITACDIRGAILSQVFIMTSSGFPQHWNNELLKPYTQRKDELSIHDGCLMWDTRAIIPSVFHQELLEELHNAHSGIVGMTAEGCSLMLWSGIGHDIERRVKTCDTCMRSRPIPTEASLPPWSLPDRPWFRLHINYAAKIMGRMILVVIDAHSKWIDVHFTSGATSAITSGKLQQSFSTHGITMSLSAIMPLCSTVKSFKISADTMASSTLRVFHITLHPMASPNEPLESSRKV